MKINKDFKNEIDTSFKEADYIGKKILIRILMFVLILGLLGSFAGVYYKKWAVNKNREIFKQSITYTESVASFLAKSYKEYNQAEDEISKKAIMDYVIQRYPNLDIEDIDNVDLRKFYKQCMKGI